MSALSTTGRRLSRGAAATTFAAVAVFAAIPGAARADHPQPVTPDITKMDYSPIGYFGPGGKAETVPSPADFYEKHKHLMEGRRFNPSGKYNAFDTNVFETLALPYRAAGDKSAEDPYGNGGDPRHGYCKVDTDPGTELPGVHASDDGHPHGPLAPVAGRCPNHQLEYSAYFAETMREILGDFGVSIRRYRFTNPGGENTQEGVAINTAAVVPGTDHPDETVIISGHFDQTDEGPASAWDSAEGHAQVVRVAKIMADYWKKTGTRPSATIKFVPWDAEESGTLGSLDYVRNNVVPGEEHKVRGYFNTDPCAGGYPAYRFGNPADRVQLGIQVANPLRYDDPLTTVTRNVFVTRPNLPEEHHERINRFNANVPVWVEQVFDHLDDRLTLAPGVSRELFVSTEEAQAQGMDGGDIGRHVIIGTSRPVLFSSDWRNFEDIGVPFFNPGPEVTGPSSQAEPNNPDGAAILHTPNDNIQTLNAYTSADRTGLRFSEGWAKGMEMCSHLLAWPMLQPEQGGTQPVNTDVVAYYEALPNEAVAGEAVRFNADGTHQVAPVRGKSKKPVLQYHWDFGDGQTGTGKRVEHAYSSPGVYPSRLTVRNRKTEQTDTMTVPITVKPELNAELSGPTLEGPAQDDDGTFELTWSRVGGGPERYAVEESTQGGLLLGDDAEGDIGRAWNVETKVTATSPAEAPRARGWERTSSTTPSLAGNKHRSGESSYWTGVAGNETGVAFESTLTSKEPVRLADGGDASLSYWSWYQNTYLDRAYVEVAVEDGDASTPLEWIQVDQLSGEAEAGWLPGVDTVFDGQPQALDELAYRRADLARFGGESVHVRFRAVWTGSDYLFTSQYGWYVDDIALETGVFTKIAEPEGQSLEITGRAPGSYAYRVRGVYEDGLMTAPSNTQHVRVGG